MSAWEVNMVSAFGRGETLALALQENGFKVRLLDFSQAFSDKYRHGTGPFPAAKVAQLPAQKLWVDEIRLLPRGLSFWLPGGPLELSGPAAKIHQKQHPCLDALIQEQTRDEFKSDWLRRFVKSWASPYHYDSWVETSGEAFPFRKDIGLIPSIKEARVQSFERFQALDYEYIACRALNDVGVGGHRIHEVEVDAGQVKAIPGQQWIWCLSSQETELIGSASAQQLFGKSVRKAEWVWMFMFGACDRGSWSNAFPEYSIVIEDIHLPWNYANCFSMRWHDMDVFEIWMKVPAEAVFHAEQRASWAARAQEILRNRLPQAHWAVNPEEWGLCPHSPVLDAATRDWRQPAWKNWDWIAPETLPRLDFSARLERESQSYQRLTRWREEQMIKQGDRRDRPIHSS